MNMLNGEDDIMSNNIWNKPPQNNESQHKAPQNNEPTKIQYTGKNHNPSAQSTHNQSSDKKLGCIIAGCLGALLFALIAFAVIVMLLVNDGKEKDSEIKEDKSTVAVKEDDKSSDSDQSKSHEIEIEENPSLENDEMDKAIDDITKGIRDNNPKLLTNHLTFNNKKISEGMARGWLDLIEYTGDRKTFADNFNLVMKQNINQESAVFEDDIKFGGQYFLKIDERDGKYSISIPQNRINIDSRYDQTIKFELLGKKYNVQTSENKNETISDIPIGIFKAKAEKVVDKESFDGEIEINPVKEPYGIISRFDEMVFIPFYFNNYDVKNISLHVDGSEMEVKDPTDTEPIIVKVKDVSEIYATGEKNGKKVTTKKVKVTKSLVHEYDDLHIKLIFEE